MEHMRRSQSVSTLQPSSTYNKVLLTGYITIYTLGSHKTLLCDSHRVPDSQGTNSYHVPPGCLRYVVTSLTANFMLRCSCLLTDLVLPCEARAYTNKSQRPSLSFTTNSLILRYNTICLSSIDPRGFPSPVRGRGPQRAKDRYKNIVVPLGTITNRRVKLDSQTNLKTEQRVC